MGEVVIRAQDVSKRFNIHKDKSLKERIVNAGRSRRHAEEFWALRDVSFELAESSTLGLIGHNGSGKSTLLKVVGGILAPTTGIVESRGRVAALLELGAGFHGDLTGRENVFLNASILGLSRKQTEYYFDAIIDFSGIEEFIDTQVKFYSSGMYVRLAFAVAVHVDPEILLIDEVLAVGDEPFQRKCLERIKQFQRDGRTIVFVTHGLDQVRQLCDRVMLLEHGRVIIDGTPIEAVRTFRERYSEEEVNSTPGDADASAPARLVGLRVTDGEGNPCERFVPGDRITVEIDVEAPAPLEKWAVGIAFQNQVDTLVYGTNTAMMRIPLPRLVGRRTVRYTFDDIPLVEGQYAVSASVHDFDPLPAVCYDFWDRGARFRVLSPVEETGLVHMRPAVSLLDEPPMAQVGGG